MLKKIVTTTVIALATGAVFAGQLDTVNTNFVVDYALMNGVSDATVTSASESATKTGKLYLVEFTGTEVAKDQDIKLGSKVCGVIEYTTTKSKNKVTKYSAASCD